MCGVSAFVKVSDKPCAHASSVQCAAVWCQDSDLTCVLVFVVSQRATRGYVGASRVFAAVWIQQVHPRRLTSRMLVSMCPVVLLCCCCLGSWVQALSLVCHDAQEVLQHALRKLCQNAQDLRKCRHPVSFSSIERLVAAVPAHRLQAPAPTAPLTSPAAPHWGCAPNSQSAPVPPNGGSSSSRRSSRRRCRHRRRRKHECRPAHRYPPDAPHPRPPVAARTRSGLPPRAWDVRPVLL